MLALANRPNLDLAGADAACSILVSDVLQFVTNCISLIFQTHFFAI